MIDGNFHIVNDNVHLLAKAVKRPTHLHQQSGSLFARLEISHAQSPERRIERYNCLHLRKGVVYQSLFVVSLIFRRALVVSRECLNLETPHLHELE